MLQIPQNVWIETHDTAERDACDVIIEMEDGAMFTALFVTLPYLRRQMELSHEMSAQFPDTPAVRYAALETPHLVVDSLDRDTVEDTIDNLLALEVFEGLFTQVTEEEDETERTINGGKRATQEVAAAVVSDVLVVEG